MRYMYRGIMWHIKNMDSQGIIYSELPLLFLTMDMAIIPRIYNVGIAKDDS